MSLITNQGGIASAVIPSISEIGTTSSAGNSIKYDLLQIGFYQSPTVLDTSLRLPLHSLHHADAISLPPACRDWLVHIQEYIERSDRLAPVYDVKCTMAELGAFITWCQNSTFNFAVK